MQFMGDTDNLNNLGSIKRDYVFIIGKPGVIRKRRSKI